MCLLRKWEQHTENKVHKNYKVYEHHTAYKRCKSIKKHGTKLAKGNDSSYPLKIPCRKICVKEQGGA